ncbi:MAG: 50S ribosomal protein L21 [Fimbriimonadaceae bacterium]
MYAIIISGGKQYRAEPELEILVDKLDIEPGESVDIEDVLLVNDGKQVSIGSPFVKGAKVRATVVRQLKDKKIEGFNYKAKKNQRKRWGHRQPLTLIKIQEVVAGA